MNEEEIKKTVLRLLKGIAPDTEPEKLTPDDNIRKSLNIDSFDYLRFIVAIDKQLGISTPEEDYGKIQTLKDIVSYMVLNLPNKTVKEAH